MFMNKKVLLKYVTDQATQAEEKSVMEWAAESQANRDYLASLKLSYIAANMPQSKATDAEMKQVERIVGNNKAVHKQNDPHKRLFKILTYISSAAAAIAVIAFILKPSINNPGNIAKIRSGLMTELKNEQIRISLSDIENAGGDDKLITVYTEKGAKSHIVLPDGSLVQLNSDTKITYPEKFIGSTREVSFSGEAYFKVKSDSLKPMIVSTNKGFTVKVYGTEFNIRSYDNDNNAITTLYKGKIDLVTSKKSVSLIPNEQIVVSNQEISAVNNPVVVTDAKAWTEGRLIFDDTPMSEVIKILERWHGVDFKVVDNSVLSYSITADFKSESIVQIMDVIKACSLVNYKIDNKKVLLYAR